MEAAAPVTATRSLCPLTLTRRTQNPDSSLWNVTLSTDPERRSTGASVPACLLFMVPRRFRLPGPGRSFLQVRDDRSTERFSAVVFKARHSHLIPLFAEERRKNSNFHISSKIIIKIAPEHDICLFRQRVVKYARSLIKFLQILLQFLTFRSLL